VDPHRFLGYAGRLVARTRRRGLLVGSCILFVSVPPASAAESRDTAAPSATAFSATSGSARFADDSRLLTTISPNGDGVRDRARINFTLSGPATATVQFRRRQPPARLVFSRTTQLHAGRNAFDWTPIGIAPGTYGMRLVLVDAAGNRRSYGVERFRGERSFGTPVVRVLGIDASFTEESSAPRRVVSLEIATDAPSFSLQIFRVGPERVPTDRDGILNGIAVTSPVVVGWRAHPNRPARLRVPIGDWPTGVYYARLAARDGRVGYAPLIIRPPRLGRHRVAVILPTNTWQAYNFWDENGDSVGDTWYANCPSCTVGLDRPYLDRGEPPHFRRYDLPFLHWLAWKGRPVDYLADSDLEAVPDGAELARRYDLMIFPGHHEYVTEHEYNVVLRYRNRGGNLSFLSANNFFWRVDRNGRTLTRVAKWRSLGRPEAALIGVQYRANDEGKRKDPFVVRNTAAAPWLFKGTGLVDGSRFTGFGYAAGPFGIEIDATAPSSPGGTKVLAEIPNLYGPGITAQMAYYETDAGAKVFAAGAFTLAGAAIWQPVSRMLDNLWAHMARP
jgi:hypothetical protein